LSITEVIHSTFPAPSDAAMAELAQAMEHLKT